MVLHPERIPPRGSVLLAPTHLSAFDVPCLMHTIRRPMDFVSITELFQNPFTRWFFTNMNAFPLNRGRVDAATTRTIFDRLKKKRAVVVFPEGRLRQPQESVLAGAAFKRGVIQIARISRTPIVPIVILGAGAYSRARAWLPLRETRFFVAVGEAFSVDGEADEERASQGLRESWYALHEEIRRDARFANTAAEEVSREILRAGGAFIENAPGRDAHATFGNSWRQR